MTLPATIEVTINKLNAALAAQAGEVDFTPSTGTTDAGGNPEIVPITDAANQVIIEPVPVPVQLNRGQGSIDIVPTDTAGLSPSGWMYLVTTKIPGIPDYSNLYFIPSTQNPVDLSELVPVTIPPVAEGVAYLTVGTAAGGDLTGLYPNPTVAKIDGVAISGTPSAGDVLTATADAAADWQPAGAGTVESVNGQTGVVVLTAAGLGAASASALTTETGRAESAEGTNASAITAEATRAGGAEGTLSSAISAETSRAEGAESSLSSAISSEVTRAEAAEATKAATTALTAETTRAETAEGLALQKASNLSDIASASAARTNLGLGSAATQPSSAFDASGAATTAQGNAETFATSAVATETGRAESAEALLAPKASPVLTGTPAAPTASALTDSTQIATTAYADSAVAAEASRAGTAEALKAPLASPALTGTPTAPTKAALTDSTAIATTAYADSAVAVETSRAEAAESANAGAVATETTRAETAEAGALQKSASLSDVASAASARVNLGLGAAALLGTPIPAADLPAATTSVQGALKLDGTPTDIAALGTQAAGSSGLAADARHVHPSTGMMTLLGTTGNSGFALQNATPTLITWTAPADGNMHRVLAFATLRVTSAETGGAVSVTGTTPDGGAAFSTQLIGGANGVSGKATAPLSALVESGSTVTVAQTSALTSGAAVVWAELWGY